MALIKKSALASNDVFSAPYGNAWTEVFTFETNASGVFLSSKTTALASGDVAAIGVLPAGLRLQDSLSKVSNAFALASNVKLGFVYADGVDDATVPQKDDYFNAALAIVTAGNYVNDNTASRPVILPKKAYLIVTIGATGTSDLGVLDVVVNGCYKGID